MRIDKFKHIGEHVAVAHDDVEGTLIEKIKFHLIKGNAIIASEGLNKMQARNKESLVILWLLGWYHLLPGSQWNPETSLQYMKKIETFKGWDYNAYILHNYGVAYDHIGLKHQDIKALRMAKKYFLQSLDVTPGFYLSKRSIKIVDENIQGMEKRLGKTGE